jgi:MSHA biogenesis protein MshQ
VTDIANNAFGAAGISPTLGLRYHDVGYLGFSADSVVDASFTAVDAGDCVASSGSNVLVGGKPGCEIQASAASAALGRFRPDHYEVSSTITPGNAGGFTYMDQDALGLTQTLRAASATGKVPLRYAAGYPVLATATLRAMATDPATGTVTDLSSRLSAPVPTFPGVALAWASGAAGIADTYRFDARGASTPLRDGPYEDFRLRMTVVDPDGVQITRNDGVVITGAGTAESPQTKIRYGRASVSNAFGAASIDLPLPAAVEYWTGAYWAANVLDVGGSTLSSPTIVQTSGTGTVNYTAGSAFSTSVATPGRFGLTLTSTGPAAVQLGYAAPTWLQYPWSGGSTMENPQARASFGLYPGSRRFIYRREVR